VEGLGQLILNRVSSILNNPAMSVRELVDRAKGGDQSVTLETLLPAVEDLLAAVERFTSQVR
jgi:hypothetical protein